jgi:hypothetical protein
MRIRREESQDVQQIRTINVAAFGTDAEANIVNALRSEAADVISLVAEDDSQVVATSCSRRYVVRPALRLPAGIWLRIPMRIRRARSIVHGRRTARQSDGDATSWMRRVQ